MTDRLFSLQQLDPEPKASPRPAAERATIGEDGIYEVEAIVAQRTFKTRKQYLIKWEGYPESDNTWVAKSNIDPALVATYEGKQLVPRRRANPRGAWARRGRAFRRRRSGGARCRRPCPWSAAMCKCTSRSPGRRSTCRR